MNFEEILKVGETNIKEYIVKQEDTADYIGNKGVTMLSTPAMIKYMEKTAACIVEYELPENYRPVGTKIKVSHINPTPVNTKFTVKATLTAIEGKKLYFDVEAFYNNCKVGFGQYEQHIINLEKFLRNS